LIDVKIEDFYFRYLVLSVMPSVPLLATLLVHQNPTLVSKISPVIARIFTPLVTVMLILFLCAFIYSGKDPYNDRDFLLIFNGVLVGVMALVLFSVSEVTKESSTFFQRISLVSLAVLAIVNNGIALSAIAFRLLELGITPNRLAVFGSNILVLIHLILVTRELLGFIRGHKNLGNVE
jgi:membrane-associated HD superfamily phosphohydrolase